MSSLFDAPGLDIPVAIIDQQAIVDAESAIFASLKGRMKHYCGDWDGMAIDETCPEITACGCAFVMSEADRKALIEEASKAWPEQCGGPVEESATTRVEHVCLIVANPTQRRALRMLVKDNVFVMAPGDSKAGRRFHKIIIFDPPIVPEDDLTWAQRSRFDEWLKHDVQTGLRPDGTVQYLSQKYTR